MSVKRPEGSSGANVESLNAFKSQDVQKAKLSEQLAEHLDSLGSAGSTPTQNAPENKTLQALQNIAANADLSTAQQAQAAVHQSAQMLVKSRINEEFREQQRVADMIDEVSDFVATDPLLQGKLLKVLRRLKEKKQKK